MDTEDASTEVTQITLHKWEHTLVTLQWRPIKPKSLEFELQLIKPGIQVTQVLLGLE